MFNKSMVCAVLVTATFAAQAQTAPTFGEIGAASAELKMQELRNKLSEAKAKQLAAPLPPMPAGLLPPMPTSMTPSPTPEGAAEVTDDKVHVVALYGVGSRMSAELRYKGWTQVVTPANLPARIGPWRVDTINATQVSIVRVDGKATKAAKAPGKGKKALAAVAPAEPERQDLYFAAETPDARAPATADTRAPSFSPFGMPSAAPSMRIPALPPVITK